MRSLALTAVVLPMLTLAFPASLSARQNAACTPASYTISSFTYKTGASSSSPTVSFTFTPIFSDRTIIEDPSATGAVCNAQGTSLDTFPNESECSTGRSNLLFDLRGRIDTANFQLIHQWKCNGQTFMSSTPRKIDPMNCTTSTDGSVSCDSSSQSFAPQSVRQICSTPTCP